MKARYYELALALHPDRTAALSPAAQQWADRRFALLTSAWQTLSDPVRRRAYEQELDLSAVGDRTRIAHWMKRHRPPERIDAPPHVQRELSAARSGSASSSRCSSTQH